MAKEKMKEAEDDVATEEGGEEKTVGGKKKLLIIVAAVLVLAGAGAGVFFSGILGGDDKKAEGEAAAESEEAKPAEEGAEAGKEAIQFDEKGNPIGGPIYMELPEFLVNLTPPGGKTSFLKMSVTLELATPQAKAVAEVNKPRIQDAFNTYLREMRASDLSGSAGIYRLREELLLRVNKVLEPEVVKDILFSEIIVQ